MIWMWSRVTAGPCWSCDPTWLPDGALWILFLTGKIPLPVIQALLSTPAHVQSGNLLIKTLYSDHIPKKVLILQYPAATAAAKSLQSCLTLCNPIDGSPPGSSLPGILQARILEWVTISFSNACMHAKSLQLCLTLCDPIDSSPPGPSVHRIL